MIKQEQPNWKETNVSDIGSEMDLAKRVEAAKHEKEWVGAGKNIGTQIWRVEKFNVKAWPEKQFGSFYGGDSYIVLNTYKDSDGNYRWDVHFWLGDASSLDERGTAAYKTVELDDLLGGVPVQHRETQGNESDLFLSYFKKGINIMQGGIESGFNKVKPEEYKPRLFHFKGRATVQVIQVALTSDSLNQGDVFVLDAGLTAFIWRGSKAGKNEKFAAAAWADSLKSDRGGKVKVEELEEEGNDDFWKILGGHGKIKTAEQGGDDSKVSKKPAKLFQLSDKTGKLEFTKVSEGVLNKGMLKSDDVFILDVGNTIFIWVGHKSSPTERKFCMARALQYMQQNNIPDKIPVVRVCEGVETSSFLSHFK